MVRISQVKEIVLNAVYQCRSIFQALICIWCHIAEYFVTFPVILITLYVEILFYQMKQTSGGLLG